MNQVYYYLDNNEQKGPLGVDQLKSVGLKPETSVWAEGFDSWKPAKEVGELKPLFSNKKTPSVKPVIGGNLASVKKAAPLALLTGFIAPFLSYIDSGKMFRKPFSWLYTLLAGLNAILPFYLLYTIIRGSIFNAPIKYVLAILLSWTVLCIACWVGFQIWWDRKDKVLSTSEEDSDFSITPVISHLFQTFGEWLGSFIAIVGFGFSMFGTIFLGSEIAYLSYVMPLPLDITPIGMILYPVYGFATLIIFRYLAELCRCLAAIANNTKATANNTKK